MACAGCGANADNHADGDAYSHGDADADSHGDAVLQRGEQRARIVHAGADTVTDVTKLWDMAELPGD